MFDNARPYAWANIFSFIKNNTNNLLIFTHRRKLWCLEHFGTRVLGGGGGDSHIKLSGMLIGNYI